VVLVCNQVSKPATVSGKSGHEGGGD